MTLEEATPVSFSIFLSKLICGVVPMPDLISKAAAYASASNSSFLDSPEMTSCDKNLPIIAYDTYHPLNTLRFVVFSYLYLPSK